ncbi:DUF397 domain-containing protein [Spongiactinospora sp. 9N601]|uniref:DUF397 domain-containing protein n=1 Tax=Spongiactinospora sp. 9N601 TaxID=3375149 RepID=UPI00379843F2
MNEPMNEQSLQRRNGPRAIAWVKSAYCEPGQCVEVIGTGLGVAVRDSKMPDGPVLCFTHAEWAAFLAGARDGLFDHLAVGGA